MKQQINYLVFGLVAIFFTAVSAQEHLPAQDDFAPIKVEKLKNDKEEVSRILTKSEKVNLRDSFVTKDRGDLKDILYASVLAIKIDRKSKNVCDLRLIDILKEKLQARNYPTDQISLESYFKMLRLHNDIDDIFLGILLDVSKLHTELKLSKEDTTKPKRRSQKDYLSQNNTEKLYSDFKKWPDGKQFCAIRSWYSVKGRVLTKRKKVKKLDYKKLNLMAYMNKDISLEVFKGLEVIRENKAISKRRLYLNNYLNKIFWAKNSLIPAKARRYDIPVDKEDVYASQKVKLFKSTTRRESFYLKYNDEQIVVMARLLKMAAVRMGVDPDVESSIPMISQELRYLDENGEYVTMRDEYVLENANDQYDYARRRLRMEMVNTSMYKSFGNTSITYEDIVFAALETGYITHEEIKIVLQYDDLWNKKDSKLMKALGVVAGIGGTAVFYLPPPYNIIGAIGMALINGKIIKSKQGEKNDNPASLFN